MQMINMTTNGGKELNPPNWSTSHLDSPEILDASDKAKPPPLKTNSIIEKRRKKRNFSPKRRTIPQGRLSCTYFHSKRAGLGLWTPFSGETNSNRIILNANIHLYELCVSEIWTAYNTFIHITGPKLWLRWNNEEKHDNCHNCRRIVYFSVRIIKNTSEIFNLILDSLILDYIITLQRASNWTTHEWTVGPGRTTEERTIWIESVSPIHGKSLVPTLRIFSELISEWLPFYCFRLSFL